MRVFKEMLQQPHFSGPVKLPCDLIIVIVRDSEPLSDRRDTGRGSELLQDHRLQHLYNH